MCCKNTSVGFCLLGYLKFYRGILTYTSNPLNAYDVKNTNKREILHFLHGMTYCWSRSRAYAVVCEDKHLKNFVIRLKCLVFVTCMGSFFIQFVCFSSLFWLYLEYDMNLFRLIPQNYHTWYGFAQFMDIPYTEHIEHNFSVLSLETKIKHTICNL